jgi:type IV fimbrial biogenesis protein FimT
MAMARTRTRCRGFTLVELMVTLAVMAILLVIAVPSFRDVLRRNQVSSASNALLANLSYARSEAIDRGQLVSMCPSADGATCSNPASLAYESGWLIYTYQAGAAVANTPYAAATAILLRANGAQVGVSIQAGDTKVVTFGQQGQLDPTNVTPPTTLKFVTCFRSGSGTGTSTIAVPGAALDVNPSGNITTQAWPVGTACTR